MKKKFLCVALVFFLYTTVLHAQSTLLLNIPDRNAGISLKYKTINLPPENGTLEADTSTWQFQIITKRKNLKVTITNTEGGQSDIISDFSKPFIISNDTLLTHA